jgi:hypothetical protein
MQISLYSFVLAAFQQSRKSRRFYGLFLIAIAKKSGKSNQALLGQGAHRGFSYSPRWKVDCKKEGPDL